MSSLRAFEAAARYRSFKQAAAELAVTPTAISHQVRALEEYLGVRLFERRTRHVVLTADAQPLYAALRVGFDSFAEAIDHLTASRMRAIVTVSATTAFTAKWLVPRVSRFQAMHPNVDLRLHASDNIVEVGANGVDIAIRYGRGPYHGLTSRPLIADRFAPVVNPKLGLRSPGELQDMPLIHFEWRHPDPAHPTWPSWFQAAGIAEIDPVSVLRFSEESHAIQAAVAGQGVALLSLTLVQDELDRGLLEQPFGPVVAGLTYHLVEAPGQTDLSRVKAAKDWLLAEIGSIT
jgi:LysR family transcriptional regulator, glycine cleavage system transcriptional activator